MPAPGWRHGAAQSSTKAARSSFSRCLWWVGESCLPRSGGLDTDKLEYRGKAVELIVYDNDYGVLSIEDESLEDVMNNKWDILPPGSALAETIKAQMEAAVDTLDDCTQEKR